MLKLAKGHLLEVDTEDMLAHAGKRARAPSHAPADNAANPAAIRPV